MVRKKAIKRVVWKILLFIIGTIIFKTPFIPVLIIYVLKAIGFRGRNFDPEADAKIKASMLPEDVARYEGSEILAVLLVPLLPYLLFTTVFPQFQEIANIIAVLTVFFLFFKPLAIDIVRIITNSERLTDKVKTIGNIAMGVLVVGCILYMIFIPRIYKARLDHVDLWKDYVKSQDLDVELADCMDDVELEFGKKNLYARGEKELEPVQENGVIYKNTLCVYYRYNTETSEWSCEHDFVKTNTYELYETTTWTGTGKDTFYTLLSSNNKYTLTLNAGKLSEATGTFTISREDGTVIEQFAVTCIESKENEYRFSFGETAGNYIDGFTVVYDGTQNAFEFYDYNIVGTLTKK